MKGQQERSEKREYRLFLDDFRSPTDCIPYMSKRIGTENLLYLDKWVVVRDFQQFRDYIRANGIPDIVSFDHDLHPDQYGQEMNFVTMKEYYESEDREMTGYDCAKWLCNYCTENKIKFPKFFVHSLNPVGRGNIIDYIENYKRRQPF